MAGCTSCHSLNQGIHQVFCERDGTKPQKKALEWPVARLKFETRPSQTQSRRGTVKLKCLLRRTCNFIYFGFLKF